MKHGYFWLYSVGLCLLLGFPVFCQIQHTMPGIVVDARTGEPVPFATIALKGRNAGIVSDENGKFLLTTSTPADSIVISSMGYALSKFAFQRSDTPILLRLEPTGVALQEVVVRSGENPAFRILRNVRSHRPQNDRNRLMAYEYDSYAKAEIALNNIPDKARKNILFRRISESLEQIEPLTDDQGRKLLPMFVSETVSHFYFRENPVRKREDILRTRVQGVSLQDADIVSQLIGGNTFQSYNFYNNYLPFLSKDFASPIGDDWKSWYSFFLADTLQVGDRMCYEIHFDPKRKQDLAFTGKMWIDTTSFALCQIEAKIGQEANLNFVNNLTIEQELEPVTDPQEYILGWLPVAVRLTAELSLTGKTALGVRAKMVLRNSKFIINQPRPTTFYDQPIVVAEDAQHDDDAYWIKTRRELAKADSITREDRLARQLLDSLRRIPVVHRAEVIGDVLATGWFKKGKIDLGPYPYLVAFNQLEGVRVRLGFRTNDKFSRHVIFRAYTAFGSLDRSWKGGFETDYILSRNHWTIMGIRMTSDLERLGMSPELMNGSKLFYAFSYFGKLRGCYRSIQREFFFRTEPIKGVLLTATVGSRQIIPRFPFQYRIKPDLDDNSPLESNLYNAYWSVEARLARKENYLMDGNERITIGTKRTPVLTLRYTQGTSSLGSDFSYHRLNLRAFQTLRLGALGRSAYTIMAGFTPSTLPGLLLFPHVGNPTFFYAPNTFNQMRFFEFISDRFVATHYQHQFDGLLFNRIPGIRKLNWRLVANADVLWGSKREANRRVESNKVMPNGSHPMQFGRLDPNKPYIEVGYGIDNIFRFLRIQAVHRLTYLQPGTDRFVVKAAAQFNF